MATKDFTDRTEDFDTSLTVDNDEEDIAILVESLKKYQTLEPYVRREAFSALRTLLSHKKPTQDFFRELQGVELMISIFQDGRSHQAKDVMENALFTLGVAVDRNDISRNALLTPEFFKLVKGTMKRKSTSSLTSAFLLLCLVSNSDDGQTLARTTKCIHKLCELLKETVVDNSNSEQSIKVCNGICSALCAVNIDPINETNQNLCCGLVMPSIVRWLYADSISRQSLHSLINLLGSCINGNSKTKTQLRLIGGLRAMVTLLDKCSSTDTLHRKDVCHLIQLINTLSCCYVSHAPNQIHAVELGTVEMLLACLTNARRNHEPQLQKTCITALVSLLHSNDNELGKQKFRDNKGVSLLIEVMATTQDEKLKKHMTFLLQKTCSPEGLTSHTSSKEESSEHKAHPETDSCENNFDSIAEETQNTTLKEDEIHTSIVINDNNPLVTTSSQEKDNESPTIKTAQEKKSETCNCGNISPEIVNSHTVLKVLLVNAKVCEYHKAVGLALQRYITKKRQQLEASVE